MEREQRVKRVQAPAAASGGRRVPQSCLDHRGREIIDLCMAAYLGAARARFLPYRKAVERAMHCLLHTDLHGSFWSVHRGIFFIFIFF